MERGRDRGSFKKGPVQGHRYEQHEFSSFFIHRIPSPNLHLSEASWDPTFSFMASRYPSSELAKDSVFAYEMLLESVLFELIIDVHWTYKTGLLSTEDLYGIEEKMEEVFAVKSPRKRTSSASEALVEREVDLENFGDENDDEDGMCALH